MFPAHVQRCISSARHKGCLSSTGLPRFPVHLLRSHPSSAHLLRCSLISTHHLRCLSSVRSPASLPAKCPSPCSTNGSCLTCPACGLCQISSSCLACPWHSQSHRCPPCSLLLTSLLTCCCHCGTSPDPADCTVIQYPMGLPMLRGMHAMEPTPSNLGTSRTPNLTSLSLLPQALPFSVWLWFSLSFHPVLLSCPSPFPQWSALEPLSLSWWSFHVSVLSLSFCLPNLLSLQSLALLLSFPWFK